ncbi:MAG: CbrC family protein [Clostridiaceae bacterium]
MSKVVRELPKFKYNGDFQSLSSCEKVESDDFIDELIHRTPGYIAWQQEELEQYLLNDGSLQGYLFKCVVCGKPRLTVDCV